MEIGQGGQVFLMGKFIKGMIPWNKGKKGVMPVSHNKKYPDLWVCEQCNAESYS